MLDKETSGHPNCCVMSTAEIVATFQWKSRSLEESYPNNSDNYF